MTPRQAAITHAQACRKALRERKERPRYVGPDLECADLCGAYLRGAYLRGSDLWGSYLGDVNLWGADLQGSDLWGSDLQNADLQNADLRDVNLRDVNLCGADLQGATMPDGRKWEEYRLDPLAGICDEPEARQRAIAAWGNHTWQDCPMHVAHGWDGVADAPEDKRRDVAAFVAVFDAGLLPHPREQRCVGPGRHR